MEPNYPHGSTTIPFMILLFPFMILITSISRWTCLVQLFLISFSENLVVQRICPQKKFEYHENYVQRKIKWSKQFKIQKATDSYYRDDLTDFVLMLILDGFYQIDSYRSWLKSQGVWRSAAAFGARSKKKPKQTSIYIESIHSVRVKQTNSQVFNPTVTRSTRSCFVLTYTSLYTKLLRFNAPFASRAAISSLRKRRRRVLRPKLNKPVIYNAWWF